LDLDCPAWNILVNSYSDFTVCRDNQKLTYCFGLFFLSQHLEITVLQKSRVWQCMKGKLKNCGRYQNGMLKVSEKIRSAYNSKTMQKIHEPGGPPTGSWVPFVISFVESNCMCNVASCSHYISRFAYSSPINVKKSLAGKSWMEKV
jgi:hypothetical protein